MSSAVLRAADNRAARFVGVPFVAAMKPNLDLRRTIDAIYRAESGRILATLVRWLGGDLELAEEAMHDAFAAALETWTDAGIPEKPRPWLLSTGRFKAIDVLRRRGRSKTAQNDLIVALDAPVDEEPRVDDGEMEDDRLRLVFICCHPALPPEAQVALTLREVCGLTTEEIAHAFLVTTATLAQRIVRAKAVIRSKSIPYQVPATEELPARLGAVLHVVYLVFNAGYSGDSNAAPLSLEAIRLGRVLFDLLPEPEVMGLLGLMLLQESRRAARCTLEGDMILLDDQDRSLWNRDQIMEGVALTENALRSRRFGAYTLQAAIAAVHAESASPAATDWHQIVLLYDRLLAVQPSAVVELNRAVAVAIHEGPEHGLALVDALLANDELGGYHLAHAARADLCRRLDRLDEARASYETALSLARQEPERRFLSKRLEEMKK